MANPRTFPQDKSNPLTQLFDTLIDSSVPGQFSAKNYVNGSSMLAHSDGNGNWTHITTLSPEGHNDQITSNTHNQASTGSSVTTGHHDHYSNGGTSHKSKGGAHHENGGASSVATDGTHIGAASASIKNISTDGNGRHFMKGDQTFTVDEGGMDYEVSDRYMIHAKGTAALTSEQNTLIKGQNCPVQIIADKDVSVRSDGQDTYVQAAGTIYLQIINSSTQIVMNESSITLQVGQKGIKIDSSGVSITKTTYVGQSNLGDKGGTTLDSPAQFP